MDRRSRNWVAKGEPHRSALELQLSCGVWIIVVIYVYICVTMYGHSVDKM